VATFLLHYEEKEDFEDFDNMHNRLNIKDNQ